MSAPRPSDSQAHGFHSMPYWPKRDHQHWLSSPPRFADWETETDMACSRSWQVVRLKVKGQLLSTLVPVPSSFLPRNTHVLEGL